MSDNKGTFLAFILGGIIGVAVGVLYAPKSGKETRKSIRRLSEDIVDNVNDLGEDIAKAGKRIYEEGREKVLSGRDKVSEAFDVGKKAFEKYTKS
ncbi:MAG: YtxH domain-containing protein [Endomicrobium sp.]|uniref:YtxH domain-containing protein n=1 Tax=Candidatus Endomicrobiellum cubanum TaxID=3242325 RepID=UPI00283075F9|nr:YtxH domain-containing protein [Endomicrobium sp.]MDR2395212.1 YtxH domain-containing protein [Endomicrobium sp.]